VLAVLSTFSSHVKKADDGCPKDFGIKNVHRITHRVDENLLLTHHWRLMISLMCERRGMAEIFIN